MSIIIKKDRDPKACGGTRETLDSEAPTVIKSKDMISFDVSSALGFDNDYENDICRISAFAVRAERGTFISLTLEKGHRYDFEKTCKVVYVEEDIFPTLVELVERHDIAKRNGSHSRTYGLPEDFGGSISVLYASGEAISISNNQSPVISVKAAIDIKNAFEKALEGKKVSLPAIADLTKIIYDEKRNNGGYTHSELTFLADGKGKVVSKQKYEDSKVYESEYEKSAEKIDYIKDQIEKAAMFSWSDLPQNPIHFNIKESTLTFVFANGEIVVRDDRKVPLDLGRAYFNVYFEVERE